MSDEETGFDPDPDFSISEFTVRENERAGVPLKGPASKARPVRDWLKRRGDLARCARRVRKGEKLLRWVKAECDLSGQMELSAAITAYLEHI